MSENEIRAEVARLSKTGQVSTFGDLSRLVDQFEGVLNRHGLTIEKGSELEAACCSVTEVLTKHNEKSVRNPNEDVRRVFTEVLGVWVFLTKIVRLENHPSFHSFLPHLELLIHGTIGQNTRLRANDDTSNKLFELLFALVLLDLSTDVRLAAPNVVDTSNPDILGVIDGVTWGFACKVVYGPSGKALFDNLKKGVQQIRDSSAQIGCVMINFRNFLDHDAFWPILNKDDYAKGGEPIFGAFADPAKEVGPKTQKAATEKRDQVAAEIGIQNVRNIFAGEKAIPGFLAFCQTASAKADNAGPVPTSLMSLVLANFDDLTKHMPLFTKLNFALHERSTSSTGT
jgi:hypothetical protein